MNDDEPRLTFLTLIERARAQGQPSGRVLVHLLSTRVAVVQESGGEAGDTRCDLTDVSCYRLFSLRPSNTERPIDPLLISPAPRSSAKRTTMATRAPQPTNL